MRISFFNVLSIAHQSPHGLTIGLRVSRPGFKFLPGHDSHGMIMGQLLSLSKSTLRDHYEDKSVGEDRARDTALSSLKER